MIKKIRQHALLILLCLCGNTLAAPLPPGIERGPTLGGISEYRLPNGLKILLMPDQTRDKIMVNITYLVGSRHEGYGESGMAHLLEHMLFKGTKRIPDAKAELERLGTDSNGTTYFDRTNYYEIFAADNKTLAGVLDFEADRMVNSRIAKSDLDSEMTVVRSEFERGENDPEDLLDNRVAATAYLWHSYGRDVIGTRSDIENVPIERLQAFYRNYYQPDNAVLVIAGRFSETTALKMVKDTFGRIPRPKRSLFPTYTREPPQDGERELVLRRQGKVQRVEALYHIPSGAHPDYPAVDVLTEILSMKPSGRLHHKLVEGGLAAAVEGGNVALREAGSLRLSVNVPLELSLTGARDALLTAAEGFAAEPVSDEEVERARNKLAKEVDLYLPDTYRFARGLSEFIGMGDWRLLFWYREQLGKVKREDVQRVAETYLQRANRTVGLFYPTDKPELVAIPAPPDTAELFRHYRPGQDLPLGENFTPTPQNIEARLIRKTLPSGMKLALLPKKTRGGTVVASMRLNWGDENSKAGKRTACTLAGIMLSRGTELRTRAQLAEELDRLRANVSVGIESASVSTMRDYLPDSLRLAAEMLRKPSFPQKEFDQAKRELITAMQGQLDDPRALSRTWLQRHMNPYPPQHWDYTPTIAEGIESLKAVTLEDARACYAMIGASNSELAIVGDFDPEILTALAQELFGDWKSPLPYTRIPARHDDVTAVRNVIVTPDKANADLGAALNIPMRNDDPDFAAMVIGNYILGGNWDSRLWRRIREKEGLSYSVGSGFMADEEDKAAAFNMYAIFAPQNAARVEKALQEELRRALSEGFSNAEVSKARMNYIQARALDRNNDAQLVARLLKYTRLGRDFSWDIAFERRITTLTAGDIRAAMRKYIDADKISYSLGGDFREAKP